MKILLINPHSSLIAKSWAYSRFFTPIAPLGLAYIAAVLRNNGFSVEIIDQFAQQMNEDDLLSAIKDKNPDVVGFAALTPVVPDLRRICSRLRQEGGKAFIVMGNIHATCFPDEMLAEGYADAVVRGEGEFSMLELCQRLKNRQDLSGVAGVSYRSGAKIIHNPDRPLMDDLDVLPYPAWDLLDPDLYTEVPLAAIQRARALPIMFSRGCTHRCYYCSQDKLYPSVRVRRLESVVDEMDHFNRTMGTRFFGYNDAYFPLDEQMGLDFCRLVIERGLDKRLKWCVETRVDKVSASLLKQMKAAGCHLIMFGVEVGNTAVLDRLNKGTTLDQAREALRLTRASGIISQGLFILGLPGETVATCEDTIRFAKELDCDLVKFNIAMPYPGSRFFEDYRRSHALAGYEKFTSWVDWTGDSGELVYSPEGMSGQTLRYLQRKAMFSFYFRPRVIFRHLAGRTISIRNFLLGGAWLISLFWSAMMHRIFPASSGAKK